MRGGSREQSLCEKCPALHRLALPSAEREQRRFPAWVSSSGKTAGWGPRRPGTVPSLKGWG